MTTTCTVQKDMQTNKQTILRTNRVLSDGRIRRSDKRWPCCKWTPCLIEPLSSGARNMYNIRLHVYTGQITYMYILHVHVSVRENDGKRRYTSLCREYVQK